MHSVQARRVVAAGVIGSVLEWYDFACSAGGQTNVDSSAPSIA
jgi:hypothetical protein